MEYSAYQKRSITILLALVPFLMGIGIDLYVPSLPAIQQYFHVSSHLAQLTIGLYMLGYAIGQFFLGVISDSVGRRRVIVLSGLFYTIVSLLSIDSQNIYLLIFYRFMQGIGIAGLGGVTRAVMSDCFSGLDFTKSMSTFSLSWAIGPIVGPFIGGYIQHYFGWKTNFLFFAVYGACLFIFTLITLPETHHDRVPFKIYSIFSTLKKMLSHASFVFASLIAAIIYSVLVIFNIIGPFLFQTVLHYSPIQYGHLALILGLSYFLGNTVNRILIQRIDPMKIAISGICLMTIAGVSMLLLSVVFLINIYVVLLPSLLIIFSCGFVLPNMGAYCLRMYPSLGGTANAIVGSLTAAGVSFISFVATAFKTQSQIPMAVIYTGISLCSLVLYILFVKQNGKSYVTQK